MSGDWTKLACAQYLRYAERRALVKTAVVPAVGLAVGGGFGYLATKHLPGDYRKRKAGLPPNLAFHYAKGQRQRYAPMHGSFY